MLSIALGSPLGVRGTGGVAAVAGRACTRTPANRASTVARRTAVRNSIRRETWRVIDKSLESDPATVPRAEPTPRRRFGKPAVITLCATGVCSSTGLGNTDQTSTGDADVRLGATSMVEAVSHDDESAP